MIDIKSDFDEIKTAGTISLTVVGYVVQKLTTSGCMGHCTAVFLH